MDKYEYKGLEIIKPDNKDINIVSNDPSNYGKAYNKLNDYLKLEVKKAERDLIINLVNVNMMGSGPIGLFIGYHHELQNKGINLVLINPQGMAKQVIDLIRLDRVLPIHETVDDYIKDIGKPAN